MGPQLYRCGNDIKCAYTPRKYAMLQWGRNFIVAETCQVFVRHNRITLSASMGPQLYRCGNVLPRDADRVHEKASMGPQLYRCGNRLLHHRPFRPGVASMGPQLYRCGNPKIACSRAMLSMPLQWGRNFIVAETFSLETQIEYSKKLQWGRNFIVAETGHGDIAVDGLEVTSMGPQLYRCGNA